MAGSGGTKACRLCLTMDSELISIDMQLENSMRNILGQNIMYESGLPKYVCDDCSGFLTWFKTFKERSLIAQTVLYQILKTSGQVTDTDVKKLNRKRLKLDTQITAPQKMPHKMKLTEDSDEEKQQEDMQQEITSTEEMLEEFLDTEDILPGTVRIVTVPSESAVKMESDDESYVMFDVDSEDLVDASNPLEEEEEDTTLKEIEEQSTLSPNHADISEGFTICIPKNMVYSQFQFPSKGQGTHATKRETYNCRRCAFTTTDVEKARKHRRKEHSDKIYSCSYCNQRTGNPSMFLSHVRKRHPLQIICQNCGYCFNSQRGLNAHIGKMHRRNHIASSPSTKLKRECKEEAIKTSKREILADLKLLCTKCGIQFSTDVAWRRHLRDDHVVREEKPKKKRENHPIETLRRAHHAIKNKEMGLRQASRFFKIPKSTLQSQLKNGSLRQKRGPPPILGEEAEGVLVDFVKNEGTLNVKAVLKKAAELTKQLKLEKFFKKGVPGKSWYDNFVRRHPELKKYAIRMYPEPIQVIKE